MGSLSFDFLASNQRWNGLHGIVLAQTSGFAAASATSTLGFLLTVRGEDDVQLQNILVGDFGVFFFKVEGSSICILRLKVEVDNGQ